MPSHVHFITYSKNDEISNVLRDLKSYTAKHIIKAIKQKIQEKAEKSGC